MTLEVAKRFVDQSFVMELPDSGLLPCLDHEDVKPSLQCAWPHLQIVCGVVQRFVLSDQPRGNVRARATSWLKPGRNTACERCTILRPTILHRAACGKGDKEPSLQTHG